MDYKQIAKLFSGMTEFVSTDKTRGMLTHVFVSNGQTLEATDGHKLLRVTAPAGHTLATGYYDAKLAQAQCKAGVAPTPIAQEACAGWIWPNTDQVIPAARGAEQPGCGHFAVDLRYMAETMNGIRIALSAWGSDHGVTLEPGSDAFSPIRFDARTYGDDAQAVAVLMPRRL